MTGTTGRQGKMGKKVLILLVVVGLVHVSSSFPTEPSLEEEVTESPTTVSSGNYSDAVVVDAAADESETTSEADSGEAKEFDPNDCFLEKSRGPCRAVIDSWYFNVVTKTCEPFMWSGCGGNNNRFGDKIQCEKQCIKGTPLSSGNDTVMTPNASSTTTSTTAAPTEGTTSTTTAAPSTTTASPASSTTNVPSSSSEASNSSEASSTTVAPSSSTVSPSSSTDAPSSTTAAPSSSTAAPPKTKRIACPKFEGCSPKCIVVQEQSNGGCKTCQCPPATASETSSVKITRSTSKTEAVKAPSVGSVSGLPVSSTDDDSSEGATEKPELPEDVCNLPPTRGHCRAMMTRYRYDPKVKNCVQFHFGGCDGNSNNFVTEEKCLEFCKGQ